MTIWTIADLHLSFGVPSKNMEVFGPAWKNYAEKIKDHWQQKISAEDLVLIPGDISWAMRLEEAMPDLAWIDALPGKKIISKGNHDYWWPSSQKLKEALPPSIDFIHNNALECNGIAFGGTRLWDTPEYSFNAFIEFRENPRERKKTQEELEGKKEEDARIFARELERLRLSLKQLSPKAKTRIALIHYPPIGADLKPSKTSTILEEFEIDICVFGHLHNVRPNSLPFGKARGVQYVFASADYLDFTPIKIFEE